MLDKLLQFAVENKVSDIHITSDEQISVRMKKEIMKLEQKVTKEEVTAIAKLLAKDKYDDFIKKKQLDVGGVINDVIYRANLYYERNQIALAIRVISKEIQNFSELNLPLSFYNLIEQPHGLILVTGPTGSGKSTTLAALINEINKTKTKHIMTIEDPIEYRFTNEKSIIHQREIGYDVHNFHDGLQSVLRQDPDVIMIGELRDKVAIETALKASETGHLVLSTLHTSSVRSTLNRLTGIFQGDEIEKIRLLLSEALVAIISQRLIKRADGDGVIPAFEVMMNTTATKNIIRKGEVGQIESYMLMDQKLGSMIMEKSIERLIKTNQILPTDVPNSK
jgi:twitching motility protein PilT